MPEQIVTIDAWRTVVVLLAESSVRGHRSEALARKAMLAAQAKTGADYCEAWPVGAGYCPPPRWQWRVGRIVAGGAQ